MKSYLYKIVTIAQKLLYLGTAGLNDYRELRAVLVVNSATSFALIVICFFIFFYLLSGRYLLILTNFLPLTVFCFVLYLNHKKKFRLAKISLLLVSNLSLPMASYFLGYDSGLHYFYNCFISVVIILFPDRNNLTKLSMVILPVALNITEKYFSDSFFSGIVQLSPEFLQMSSYFAMFFSCMIIGFVMYSFSLTVDTYHLKILKDEEDRIESSKLEALAVLSAGVAHEINNPLAIISSRADQLLTLSSRRQLQPEKLESISHNIKKHSMRISKIISGLRSFSRSSKDEIPSPTSLRHIINECSELFPTAVTGQHIAFTIENFRDVQIVCRQVQIMQVIINLVNNACDEIKDQQRPWIRISVSQRDNIATIRVTDSGNGIDPDIAKKIMQPFFTTKEVGKGTGLGLSISSSIMEKQGGRLYIDHSSENTCFAFEIPCIQEGESTEIKKMSLVS